jgi:hypothetical protein
MPAIVAMRGPLTGRFVKIVESGKTLLVRLDGGQHGPYDKFHMTGRQVDSDGKITRLRWYIILTDEGKFPSWISWRCPCCDDPSYQDDEGCLCAADCPNA